MLDKTNHTTQRPFKIFFINFKRTSANLESVVKRIEEDGFIKVEYDAPWFWKVTLAKKKVEKENDDKAEKKGPRIMGRDE